MYLPEIKTINGSSNIFQSSLQRINKLAQSFISLFFKTFPSPSSSLLLGIIFEIKEPISKDFINNLRNSGVFHVIAASGMNATLGGGFISTFFCLFL